LFKKLQALGVKKLVFVGASDLAEIAFLTLQETEIDLIAVLDDERVGNKFLNLTVKAIDSIEKNDFDRILITATESLENLRQRLRILDIDGESILVIR
jgi:NADH/NAD ratio-sensing transcriptional regulator Rex